MLVHPDKRTKLGVELAGGINRSDHALHLAQEAYKDALRWPIVKNNSLALSSPTPAPTCPTRQGPAPTESGPLAPLSTCPTRQVPAPTEPEPSAPLSSTEIQVPKASPPTLSQARDLRLRQEMLLRRELSLNKDGGPTKPKAPPPTLSAEEKEHLRWEFGNGKLGAESISRSHDANQGQQG